MTDAIDAVRAFNRFYTNRLGVLGKAYLDTPYTLTEARILYELGAAASVSASGLVRDLQLDPAYLSRILKRFRGAGLLDSSADPNDMRSQVLTLTDAGRALCDELARRSRRQVADRFDTISTDDQTRLIDAMRTIQTILEPSATARPAPAIIRPPRDGDIGWVIRAQAEFYSREYGWDTRFEGLVAEVAGTFLSRFDPQKDRCWIAEQSGRNVGSVFVANGGDGVAKLRLLYVDKAARGLGLGQTLVEECVRFSRQSGYRQLSLWTNDILDAARRIYQRQGFRLVAEERHRMFGPELNGQTWILDL